MATPITGGTLVGCCLRGAAQTAEMESLPLAKVWSLPCLLSRRLSMHGIAVAGPTPALDLRVPASASDARIVWTGFMVLPCTGTHLLYAKGTRPLFLWFEPLD